MELMPITGRLMQLVCTEASKSVAGPDGFEPAEMAMLADSIYDEIAKLPNMVEEGH